MNIIVYLIIIAFVALFSVVVYKTITRKDEKKGTSTGGYSNPKTNNTFSQR